MWDTYIQPVESGPKIWRENAQSWDNARQGCTAGLIWAEILAGKCPILKQCGTIAAVESGPKLLCKNTQSGQPCYPWVWKKVFTCSLAFLTQSVGLIMRSHLKHLAPNNLEAKCKKMLKLLINFRKLIELELFSKTNREICDGNTQQLHRYVGRWEQSTFPKMRLLTWVQGWARLKPDHFSKFLHREKAHTQRALSMYKARPEPEKMRPWHISNDKSGAYFV
jgi:hypothetical protein